MAERSEDLGEVCTSCQQRAWVYFYCDEAADGPWCEACFAATPCGRGEHDEGCATKVFDG
jgi:hypothetical protein